MGRQNRPAYPNHPGNPRSTSSNALILKNDATVVPSSAAAARPDRKSVV